MISKSIHVLLRVREQRRHSEMKLRICKKFVDDELLASDVGVQGLKMKAEVKKQVR